MTRRRRRRRKKRVTTIRVELASSEHVCINEAVASLGIVSGRAIQHLQLLNAPRSMRYQHSRSLSSGGLRLQVPAAPDPPPSQRQHCPCALSFLPPHPRLAPSLSSADPASAKQTRAAAKTGKEFIKSVHTLIYFSVTAFRDVAMTTRNAQAVAARRGATLR